MINYSIMFTGIVEEVGKISRITRSSGSWKIAVASKAVAAKVALSGSVAVDGACLTVVKKDKNALYFDAVEATLKRSSLKRLRVSDKVNLESSLAMGDKLQGHFVLGHIDCEARVKKIAKVKDAFVLEVELPAEGKKYLVGRGSIAIDGISLTVAEVKAKSFSVNIIPYTWQHTTLKDKRAGSFVNLEFDYLGKLVVDKL
ncbi:riboflavin synthase [Candidatus Omnitrophota bacterium]